MAVTVNFPLERVGRRGGEPDLAQLRNVLIESAELLEAAQASDDEDLREGSVELAIRSLKVASQVLERISPEHGRPPAPVLSGPWIGSDSRG